MDRAELSDTLLKLDLEASLTFENLERKLDVIIVGGSVFMLRKLTNRAVTHDIDFFDLDRRLYELIKSYPSINTASATFINEIPYNYEDRLTELDLPTKAIRYLVPSNEDLAVMKLYAYRPNDIADLNSPAFICSLDKDLLEKLVYDKNEAPASAMSERRYTEMVYTYERYKKEALS